MDSQRWAKSSVFFSTWLVPTFLTFLRINIQTIDYESEKIDLSDSRVYRDLSKPVGKFSTIRIFLLLHTMPSFSTLLLRSVYDRGIESRSTCYPHREIPRTREFWLFSRGEILIRQSLFLSRVGIAFHDSPRAIYKHGNRSPIWKIWLPWSLIFRSKRKLEKLQYLVKWCQRIDSRYASSTSLHM